jgi:hypothetical protein
MFLVLVTEKKVTKTHFDILLMLSNRVDIKACLLAFTLNILVMG